MKTLSYYGFSKPCECRYAIGEVDGKKAVVFQQGPLTNTSITNMVEVLASKLLSDELRGTSPAEVRFFEHYPKDLNPLREWQEVSFEEVVELGEEKGLIAKLLGLLGGESEPKAWAVDRPRWTPITPTSEILALVDDGGAFSGAAFSKGAFA